MKNWTIFGLLLIHYFAMLQFGVELNYNLTNVG